MNEEAEKNICSIFMKRGDLGLEMRRDPIPDFSWENLPLKIVNVEVSLLCMKIGKKFYDK